MISYSFNLLYKVLAVALLFTVINLDYSNAQSVRLRNSDFQILNGALVIFSSIPNDAQAAVVHTNQKGEAWVLGFDLPLVRSINYPGFSTRIDTIYEKVGLQDIVLTKIPVSLGEVVVTGNHVAVYQRDAVVAVQVLGTSDFEKRGAVTVKDLLSQELNMRVAYDPAVGGSSLSIQGTGGEHIKILMDGIPMIGRQNGNIDLGQINLNNLEKVEIVKGPMSVLYGTDALGGVINLISKKNQSDKWMGSAAGYYESTGQYNSDISLGVNIKNTSVSLSGARNYFDGFDPDNANSRSQLWNPREQYLGDVKITHTIKSAKLSLHSSFFKEEMIDKADVLITPYYAYANDQYFYTTRINNSLSFEKKFKNESALNILAAYSMYKYEKNTFRKNMVNLTESLTPDLLDDDTTQFNALFFRATHSYARPNSKWSLLSGVDMNDEVGEGKRIDGAKHRMTDVAGYVSIDFKPIEYFVIRPAVRAIYNSQFDNAPLVPSISVLYRSGNTWAVRSSLSKGYRAPSLKEQYLYFVDNGVHNVQGNPNLEAETSTQVMASVEYKKLWSDFVLSVEPGFFYNNIHNKISLVQYDVNSLLYTYVNLDKFISKGLDFKSKLAHHQFTFQAGVSYTGTWGTFEGDVEQPNVAWYPEFTTSADYTIKKTKTTISVFWKMYGERPIFIANADGSVDRLNNDAYKMMDVSVRQELIKNRLTITGGLKNIYNVTNLSSLSGGGAHSGESSSGTPVGMGISVFTKLTFNFRG